MAEDGNRGEAGQPEGAHRPTVPTDAAEAGEDCRHGRPHHDAVHRVDGDEEDDDGREAEEIVGIRLGFHEAGSGMWGLEAGSGYFEKVREARDTILLRTGAARPAAEVFIRTQDTFILGLHETFPKPTILIPCVVEGICRPKHGTKDVPQRDRSTRLDRPA